MLEEGKNIRQRSDEGYRRWFFGDLMELILWYDRRGGTLIGFQLCYDKLGHEKAYSRFKEKRSHRYIAQSSNPPNLGHSMGTGILTGDAGRIADSWIKLFHKEFTTFDPMVGRYVLDDLEDYNRNA